MNDFVSSLFRYIICFALIFTSVSQALTLTPEHAGKLKNFETKTYEDINIGPSSGYSPHPSFLLLGLFTNVIYKGLAYAGLMSNQRVNPDSYTAEKSAVKPRHSGEAGLPFARLDIDSHYTDSNIDTFNYRVEAGYGLVAVNFRQSHFWEKENGQTNKQRLEQLLFLYRMSFSSMVEIDLGLGRYQVRGEDVNNSTAFSLPIIFHPSDYFGFEFRPTWSSNGIRDHELSVLAGWDYFKFRAGYRWIEINDVDLNGPFIGITAHY